MSKTHARPRTTAQAKTTAIPPQLAGLLALYSESPEAYRDDIARALETARRALRNPFAADAEVFDAAWTYITGEAERGPWRELHQAIGRMKHQDDSAFNATTGDFHNVYGSPAVLFGMALAYVYLQEGGAR